MQPFPSSSVSEPVAVLTRFSRSLRDEGLPVGTGRVVRFCRAAALLEPGDLYWAGRATLVSRPQDVAVYDRVFAAFFGGSREAKARSGVRVRVTGDLEPEVELALASPLELLRQKSFADCSPDELAQLADLMARVSLAVPLVSGRVGSCSCSTSQARWPTTRGPW